MTNHLRENPDASVTPADIAATLVRVEEKLDAVLERLQWAPRSEAGWYAELYPKYSGPHAKPDVHGQQQ